jgi:hypothetical protein
MCTFPVLGRRDAAAAPARQRVAAALVAGMLAFAALPAGASPALAGDAIAEARLLKQLYLIGLSRMARGDAVAAIGPFQVVTEVAPELSEVQHLLAVAMVVADFPRRSRALPIIDKALADEPSHPLSTIVRVMADPESSVLRSDGALYMTAAAATRLREALPRLERAPRAYNARYLAPVLEGMEPTGEADWPARLPGFARLLGPDGRVALAKLGEGVPFSRLFAMSIADERFAPHVRNVVASLPSGVVNLASGEETPPFGPTAQSGQATMEILFDGARLRRR